MISVLLRMKDIEIIRPKEYLVVTLQLLQPHAHWLDLHLTTLHRADLCIGWSRFVNSYRRKFVPPGGILTPTRRTRLKMSGEKMEEFVFLLVRLHQD